MDAFIARQPIFDRKLRVEGYELLFRSGLTGVFDMDDPDLATSKVISNVLRLSGFEDLASGKKIFVNIPREFLLKGLYRVLPTEVTVLEILETIEYDQEILEAVGQASKLGYRIALDDFVPDRGWEDAFSVVDFVKVDVLASPKKVWKQVAELCRPFRINLLAEKVEDRDTHAETSAMGYQYFQGYFFARPEVRSARDIPASQLTFLQMLHEVHKPNLDLVAIEALIQQELALSYKLFRFLRSAYFGWRRNVASVHHALLVMGEREFRSWASVIAVAGMATGKPGELITQANIRGRFCELLAEPAGMETRSLELFFLGLFSMLEAILDRPMAEVLGELAIDDEVRDALLGQPGPLRDVLAVVTAYTGGDWGALEEPAARLKLNVDELPLLFAAALCESGRGLDEEADGRVA